jgi:hypothetical protein
MSTFGADLSRFVKKTKLKSDVVLRKIAFDALRGVVMMTPVDTGRARGSWRVGINLTDLTTLPAGKLGKRARDARGRFSMGSTSSKEAATAIALNLGSGQISKAVFGNRIAITNNVVYVPYLERGRSKQAPNGMLRVTFERIKASIRSLVKK